MLWCRRLLEHGLGLLLILGWLVHGRWLLVLLLVLLGLLLRNKALEVSVDVILNYLDAL